MVYWQRIVTFSDLPLSIAISKAGNFRDPLNFREPVMKKFYILSRAMEITRQYSRLPITWTKKVGVIGSSKQISKMMVRECKYQHTSPGWTVNLNWSDKNNKDKESTPLFWNKFSSSDFRPLQYNGTLFFSHLPTSLFDPMTTTSWRKKKHFFIGN